MMSDHNEATPLENCQTELWWMTQDRDYYRRWAQMWCAVSLMVAVCLAIVVLR